MFRKLIIVIIFVALYKLGRIVQVLILLGFMIACMLFTMKKRPYLTRRLNDLELLSLSVATATVCFGTLFVSSREREDTGFITGKDCKIIILHLMILI